MKKNYYILILPLLLGICLIIEANPTISFFFKPLGDVEKVIKKLKKPGNLAKHTVRSIVNIEPVPVAGIFVVYSGFITSSNYHGQIVLPRKHYKSTVTLVVTSEITPVSLFENTYLHWSLVSGVPAAMYSCEQKYNEMEDELYWQVEELPFLAGNQIPVSAIVIIAKPKNVFIPVGKIPTIKSANLVLPDVYVKKGLDIVKHGADVLTIRHLFRPVTIEEKHEPFKMLTQISD